MITSNQKVILYKTLAPKPKKKLNIRRTNTNYGNFDIRYSAAKAWNDIPLGKETVRHSQFFKNSPKITFYHHS